MMFAKWCPFCAGFSIVESTLASFDVTHFQISCIQKHVLPYKNVTRACSGSLTPKNIILDTWIIKICHLDQFIMGGSHGHRQELIAAGATSQIDHYDLS